MVAFLADAEAGFRGSLMLIALRWRMIRNESSRLIVKIGAAVILAGLVAVMNLGLVAQNAAMSDYGYQSDLARTWTMMLAYDYYGSVGAFALGGVIAVALFAPFTGTSTQSLAAGEDLAGVRAPRLHRFFDALALNAVSGLGILQLLVLTGVASLMTMDGVKLPAIIWAWTIWAFAITAMTTLGWALEWVVRRFGIRSRALAAAGIAGLVAAGVAADPFRGRRLFGLADWYSGSLRVAADGWSTQTILLPFATLAATVLVGLAGLYATRCALLLEPPLVRTGKVRRARTLPADPRAASWVLLHRVVSRTPEVRRALVGLTAVGTAVMLAVDLDRSAEFSLVAAAPLTVALSWASNAFGLLGTGMVWLGSQPRALRPLPWIVFGYHILLSSTILALLWTVSFAAGNADPANLPRLAGSAALTVVVSAALSAYFSVTRPHRARLTSRGDAILPPMTALGYLGALLLTGPVPVALMATTSAPWIHVTVAAAILGLSAALLALARLRWADGEHRSRVIAEVSAA